MGSPRAVVRGPRTSTVVLTLETERRRSRPTNCCQMDSRYSTSTSSMSYLARRLRILVGDLVRKRIGVNSNPDHDRTANLFVSLFDGDKSSDVNGRPANLVVFQHVQNQGTHGIPDCIELVTEHTTDLLENATCFGSLRLDPGVLRASCTPDELRRGRRDACVVMHRLILGDNIGRGLETARRVVAHGVLALDRGH